MIEFISRSRSFSFSVREEERSSSSGTGYPSGQQSDTDSSCSCRSTSREAAVAHGIEPPSAWQLGISGSDRSGFRTRVRRGRRPTELAQWVTTVNNVAEPLPSPCSVVVFELILQPRPREFYPGTISRGLTLTVLERRSRPAVREPRVDTHTPRTTGAKHMTMFLCLCDPVETAHSLGDDTAKGSVSARTFLCGQATLSYGMLSFHVDGLNARPFSRCSHKNADRSEPETPTPWNEHRNVHFFLQLLDHTGR